MLMLYPDMSPSPIVWRIVSEPSLFCIVDAGETKITSPRRSTMELTSVVWMSWIYLKWKHCKGIKGYSSKHGLMVEEDPLRRILGKYHDRFSSGCMLDWMV